MDKQGSLEREARRALRALARPLAVAELDNDGIYDVVQIRSGVRTRLCRLDKRWLNYFQSRDWVIPVAVKDGVRARFKINTAGRAFLAREVAKGDPYLNQHRRLKRRVLGLVDGAEFAVTINQAESPLAWLRSRQNAQPAISDTEFEAGERLRQDYTRAQMGPRVTADWTRPSIDTPARNGVEEVSDSALEARMRVSKALAACGPGLADVLYAICCELKGIGPFERETGWPQRSAKVVLKIALNRLARHYGLIAPLRDRSSPIRAWAAE